MNNGQWFWIYPTSTNPGLKIKISDISAVNGNIHAVTGTNNRCMGSLKNSWTNEVQCSDNKTFHVICQFVNIGLSSYTKGNKYFLPSMEKETSRVRVAELKWTVNSINAQKNIYMNIHKYESSPGVGNFFGFAGHITDNLGILRPVHLHVT